MRDDQRETLTVGTLNLRNTSDRWPERWPLMREQLVALQPDILGVQELRRPSRQRSTIVGGINAMGRAGLDPYRMYPAFKTGIQQFWEGIGILTHADVVSGARLDLRAGNRVAQRLTLRIPDSGELDVYNTHLDHAVENDEVRLAQVERLLSWINKRGDRPGILVGDFNSQPGDTAIVALKARFRSAYAEIHGAEPPLTVPTPLGHSWGNEEKVLDYIFVSEHIRLHDAWITFDDIDEEKRLAASDHYGLAARISLD